MKTERLSLVKYVQILKKYEKFNMDGKLFKIYLLISENSEAKNILKKGIKFRINLVQTNISKITKHKILDLNKHNIFIIVI